VRNSVAPFLLFCLMSVSLVCAAQNGKVETIGLPPEPDLLQSVRQVLEPKGYRVALDDGSVACELWLRKSVPSQPKKDVQGAIYTELGESTLVGVLHFPQASTDYRGQAIPAGFYTLRYELLPNDGNHLGAAPNRDFLLLIPAGSDADPNVGFKLQELVNLSRKARAGTAAAVSKDDQEHWTFSGGVKLDSGQDVPFALVVKGTAQQYFVLDFRAWFLAG